MIKINRKAFIVTGLAYGDEGKGSIVDYLVRKYYAHTVFRFNGGPQAAHHVVSPDGTLHCFSQFSSGTFVPGVKTFLARFMSVDPLALEKEGKVLLNKGFNDCFGRIIIDKRCLVVTPIHKLFGRMLEISRGDLRHGSCGMGAGQTVFDAKQMGSAALVIGDLSDELIMRDKLKFLLRIKVDIAEQLIEQLPKNSQLNEHFKQLIGIDIEKITDAYLDLYSKVDVASKDYIAKIFEKDGNVIFEGAQGVLLDIERGFWPHVTKTCATYANAEKILQEVKYLGDVYRIGVVRVYGTRHGAGPFVTEDKNLAKLIPDNHNGFNDWQEQFRIGWFDLIAAKYALSATGKIRSIAITNIDRLRKFDNISVCVGYSYSGDLKTAEQFFECKRSGNDIIIDRIKFPRQTSKEYQGKLAVILQNCQPIYKEVKREKFVHFLEKRLNISIVFMSSGPKATDKTQLKTLY